MVDMAAYYRAQRARDPMSRRQSAAEIRLELQTRPQSGECYGRGMTIDELLGTHDDKENE